MASIVSALRRRPGTKPGSTQTETNVAAGSGALLLPLALAQLLASYNGSAMGVAISAIANDLHSTVTGVQAAISFFTLTMAALMITGSKLTDIWGRKNCFIAGIWLFGIGAIVAAVAPGIGVMFLGFSLLQGLASALFIPPVYILLTVAFDDVTSRAKAFAVVSAMAGLGAAAGPLIGGTITTTMSWRVSFGLEAVVVVLIWWAAQRGIHERPLTGPKPRLDLFGAALSGGGLAAIVVGILLANTYGWITARKDFDIAGKTVLSEGSVSPVWLFVGIGLLLLVWFAIHIWRRERHGKEPLVHIRLFANRTSNLGLITQTSQWFIIQGGMFVVALYLQVSLQYSAIKTGILITPMVAGMLLSSAVAGRLARKRSQRTIIRAGFVTAIVGIVLLVLLVHPADGDWRLVPGLLCLGFGVGIMLTASVNVVQSSVPEEKQGELSGVSRSASNLGSSLGVAIAGSVLVAALIAGATAGVNASTAFTRQQQQQFNAALQHQTSALSDSQVQSALEGQPASVASAAEQIYSDARNKAMGYGLITVGAVGVLGLLAALGLPATPSPETASAGGPPTTGRKRRRFRTK